MTRILIIDDDEQFVDMLSQVLERNRYHVIKAYNGNMGIDAFKNKGADLIITDLFMPEKEGLETILDIRNCSASIPIIAISGGSRIVGSSNLNVASSFGANRIFEKPIDRQKLLTTIKELI